jgi:hypothetical protein
MSRLLLSLPCGLALAVLLHAQQPGGLPLEPAAPASNGLPPGLVPDTGASTPIASPSQPISPPNPFPIMPEAGAWMICAASYVGPDAPELSRQLCLEVRNKFKMPAYIFNHADQERQRQREAVEKLRQQYPGVPWRNRTVKYPEQCAVLVGGYKSFEEASAALPGVKKLPLPKLDLGSGKLAYDYQTMLEPADTKDATILKPKAQAPVNPFTTAMVVHNPTVPQAPRQQVKFDPIWKELNADEEYSLLKNRQHYTLVVKEYTGINVVHQRSLSSSFLKFLGGSGQQPGEALNAAARQAEETAKFLRNPRLGFEAYVFHTRDRSIVTVGGFAQINDDEMNRLMQRLAMLKFRGAQGGSDPIGLMASPLPMEVPHP